MFHWESGPSSSSDIIPKIIHPYFRFIKISVWTVKMLTILNLSVLPDTFWFGVAARKVYACHGRFGFILEGTSFIRRYLTSQPLLSFYLTHIRRAFYLPCVVVSRRVYESKSCPSCFFNPLWDKPPHALGTPSGPNPDGGSLW